MPTSGVTDWALTAGDVCRQAAIELGVISSGENLTADEQADCLLRLNGMLKTWGGEANLWRDDTATVTIAAGVGAATLPADVRDLSSVRLVVSSTFQRPLAPWNRAQYFALPNRSQTAAQPTAYYVQQGRDGDEIRLWPVNIGEVTLHIDYSRGVETVTDADETLDLPQDWQEAVIYGLASRIANMFGTTRLDPGAVQRVDARGRALYEQLLDRDRPDSYYFESWDNAQGLYR
jgi:hypothetical protein